MASLADIYKSEKSQGGGLGSAIGKSMKESLDPRNLLNQDGLLTSMFPSMKGYSALGDKKKDKDKKGSSGGSGNSPSKASFDEVLSNLGTKTTFERLQKAQVMSMKYTSVLPEMSKDLKNINKLLKAMIDDSGEGGGILDTILDALGLGDMFGKRKVRPGARERLKRIQGIKAARVAGAAGAGAAGAAKAVPKPTPTAEGVKYDETAKRFRDAKTGRFVKAPTDATEKVEIKSIKELIKGKAGKLAGRVIPGLGIALGLWEVGTRLLRDPPDYTGAAIATGSGAASMFPGIGTGIAIAGFASNMARDVYKDAYGVYPERDDEKDEEGRTVPDKFKEIYDGIIEEISGKKNIQPIPPEARPALDEALNKYLNARRGNPRAALEARKALDAIAREYGINAETLDKEIGNARAGKSAVLDDQSKVLEELTNQYSQSNQAPSSEAPAASPTPAAATTPNASTDSAPTNVNVSEQNNITASQNQVPNLSSLITPTPETPSLENAGSSVGGRISSISSDVSDAQMAAASTPIVTSVPAKSSMNTPPSDSVDMTRLPIASVYNDEFMTEFFGSRQQSFATG